MSVSLIVLRLELADDTPDVQDFHYIAPEFESTPDKLTYAEAVEKKEKKFGLSKSELQKFRGRREYQTLSLRTYYTEEVRMDVDVEDMGTVHASQQDTAGVEVDLCQYSSEKLRSEESKSPAAVSPRSGSEESHTSFDFSPKSSERNTPEPIPEQAQSDQASADSQRKPAERSSVKRKTRRSAKGADSDLSEGACSVSRPNSGKGKNKSSGIGNTIRFFSGNPAVENTEGIIHLYKNNQMTSLTEDVTRSEMICMLTVPAAMTTQDLLLFVAPAEPWLENLKIIQDGTPNQYMVLLKFSSQKYADDFYKNFNSIPYNSIEPEICHLAYVAKIETMKASEGASLPVSGLTELPVCPVCLEKMDESVDGILTILCNHSFHGSCLAQWGDTSCPVCRYVQTPEPVPDNKCFHCDSNQNLWICLICGNVGCGRYEGGHAFSHFQETNHTYSMQLENNRVWDYAGDNYVHRLVQNKGDGKLVAVDEGGNVMEDEKLDSITLEYTYLLTSQLEAQRHHFEEKIGFIEKEAFDRMEEMETRSKKTLEQCTKLEHELLLARKEKQGSDRKCQQLNTKVQKLSSELAEERELNKSLRQNQSQWQTKVNDLEKQLHSRDKELSDLQEQLRDVMFYLEAQQKLSSTSEVSQEEIQEGQIVVNSPSGGATSKKGRKKGGR